MSVTSGFFNSTNRDRLYNATDFGRFFDGIVTDGVIRNYEQGLAVTPFAMTGSMQVCPGKAWFNGTWTIEDEYETFACPRPTIPDGMSYFAIVLEVNFNSRANTIKLVTVANIAASESLASVMTNRLRPIIITSTVRYSGIHQYVLAVASKSSNSSETQFATFQSLIGETLASSSPYYALRDVIAPYAIGLSYDGTIPDPFDYTNATNKPSINGVTLSGNKTTEDLGITAASSIFLGAAQISTGSSAANIHLVYSNVGTLPSGNPKKIILYGTYNSFFYFRLEYVYLASQYCPVSATTSDISQESVVPRTSVANSLMNFAQSGASVSFDIISLTNRSALNNILETELVW